MEARFRETVVAITALMEQIDRDRKIIFGMAHFVDLLLDARELARRAITESAFPEHRDEMTSTVRAGLGQIEVAIDAFIAAQPDSDGPEDQRLMDRIVEPLNYLDRYLGGRELPDTPAEPPHLH